MSTVDLTEVRRQAERYVARAAVGAATLLDADALLAYLPLLLNEVEQLRAETVELRRTIRSLSLDDGGERG